MKTIRLLLAALILLITAACAPDLPPVPTAIPTLPPDQIIRQIATVNVPPTLDPASIASTRRAEMPTPTIIPTRTLTPTAYIGVFIGGGADSGVPIVDAAQYAGTLSASEPLEFPTLGSPCIIAPDPLYGGEWSEISTRIGCPGEPITSYVSLTMIFENGVMYALPTGEIYAIAPGGITEGRYWYAPVVPPEQGWEILPPPGLLPPTGVFAAMWRAVEEVRQTLGYAQTSTQSVTVSLQRFERGALLLDGSAGQVFAVIGTTGGQLGGGAAFGPYISGLESLSQ